MRPCRRIAGDEPAVQHVRLALDLGVDCGKRLNCCSSPGAPTELTGRLPEMQIERLGRRCRQVCAGTDSAQAAGDEVLLREA